jgi:hypothetical protein
MTTKPIIESGMTFGPYPDGHCFYIEKSDCYKAIREHVQMAEFLLLPANKGRSPALWIVEAKSSTPRPETQPNFESFIAEIREKLINAFSLGWASCLRRHENAKAELPEAFKALDLSQTDVKFVLVIKGHQEAWLPPLQDALGIALRSTVKTWAFSPTSVAVINDKLAQQYGLILPTQGDHA